MHPLSFSCRRNRPQLSTKTLCTENNATKATNRHALITRNASTGHVATPVQQTQKRFSLRPRDTRRATSAATSTQKIHPGNTSCSYTSKTSKQQTILRDACDLTPPAHFRAPTTPDTGPFLVHHGSTSQCQKDGEHQPQYGADGRASIAVDEVLP